MQLKEQIIDNLGQIRESTLRRARSWFVELFAIGDDEGEQYNKFHRGIQQIHGWPEMDNMTISKGTGRNVSSNSSNTTLVDAGRA